MSKLLIVDDEEDIREFAKRFFTKRGVDVITASTGQQALQLIEEEKPDLVLLDVQMEKMTGVEVLQTLRKNNNDTKVMMVTGTEDETVINAASKLGAKEYIHKPLVLEELEKIVMAELN